LNDEGLIGMLGTIKSIEEVFDLVFEKIDEDISFNGYKITTDQHVIHVLIDNDQKCCERWGYFSSEDDHNQYIGCDLRAINVTDTALKQCQISASERHLRIGSDVQFVDFVTSGGVFQLAVYNAHNGYYGHPVLVLQDDEVVFDKTM
jgi:hypothetical protein